ncbi:MAG: tryptophan-rich sensory protein [Alphaproteobacteria bacterium]|nr:tryptophan-rich sensory protein [Alphaproteobacteria bacterium]
MIYVFIIMVVVTAASGAIFKPGAWYESLAKPSWTPPNRVFPMVWTTLYIMMVIAAWLVWRQAGMSAAIVLWGLQLVANLLWSALFFGMRRMELALIDALILWVLVAAFIVVALPHAVWASVLFIPYLCWVTIAVLLNFTIRRLNPNIGQARP